MKRLRLVQLPIPQPAALAATGNVPLAAGCLGVSARVHGLAARGLELEVVPPAVTDAYGDTLLADYIARDEPDYVGLSLYLWNVERSLHLAREVRRRSPRTKVLIGGPEVSSDNPFVLSQTGFDIAVTGEAEDTFGQVMGRLLDGREVAGLPGVAVRQGLLGLGPFGPAPSASFPLTDYPSPYLEDLVPVEAQRSTYIETVRGCRSHCTYCFYPRSSNVLRVLDVARSASLVAALRERGAREVVYLDPTFNHRPEFEELLDALAAVNPDRSVSCFAEVRAEGLTADHARRLARAGFTKLEMGLQSVNRETLKRVKRGGSPEKVAAAAKMLRAEGIDLLVDLIIGLPGDTPDDVARGVDFLLEHELGEHAQVFVLSLLPGTAMRTTAAADGVEYERAPPYRVTRTATFDTDQLRASLFDAEEKLGRRLDELPRPHLVAEPSSPVDVLTVDLDRPETLAQAALPGAQHVALWLRGRDLFGKRELALRALELRLAVDPYSTLDVVLCPEAAFPLDLVDLLRARLARATPSYASRALALRGEDMQRRLSVVLQSDGFPADWVHALRDEVPVFREQSARQAAAHAEQLGDTLEGARIMDDKIDRAHWSVLVERADSGAVAFARREHEAAWVQRILRYGDVLS
ncbi:MAG: Fe-S oxidoreductase [Myxococcaceae bacterium]|nr:Fe-S oxidoreductase [Myxococcaceae bacterium]